MAVKNITQKNGPQANKKNGLEKQYFCSINYGYCSPAVSNAVGSTN